MANDDNSGASGGGGTWDASRAADESAESHRASVGSSVGAPPPGDIGPYADRKIGHFTQMQADAPPSPARVGGVSLVAFEAGREPPPMPLPSLSVGTAAPVQRSAAPAGPRASHLDWASGGPMPEAQVHARAAEGVAGAGGPVPYRAELERSMGPSAAPLLDRISVHQDSPAQAASAAIGAQAYATGDRIALPPSPSLHLVAHEVAHVAQQAEGVHLAGGVGQESDPHERAADAFADAVVDGRPVPFAGSGAGGVRPSVGHVQRRTAHESSGPATPKPADAGDSTPHAAGGESAATEHAFDELEPWQLVAEVGQPAWTPERAVAIDREVRARTQRLAKQSGDAVASSQRAGGHVSGVAEAIQLDELTKPLLAIHTEALTHLAMPLSGTNRAALAAYVGWFADAHARWTPAHAAFKAWLLDQHLWEDVNGSGTTGGTRESPGLGSVGAVNAALYVSTHATAISQATSRYLQAVPWTPVHARLAWRDAHGFAQEVSRELASAWDDLSSPEMLQALADAVRPADALAIVDQMRPMVSEGAADRGNAFRGGALGSSVWQASIGVAIAQLVHSAVVESARRLGTRWVAAADAAHRGSSAVATGIGVPDLAPSSPLDAHVARALTGIDIVAYTPPTSAAPAEPAPKRHARVSVAWQGASSPSLWNWVKADPPDATAEEVADALWPRGAYRAHTLIGAAPLFGVPPELAREFEEARAHAPEAPGPLAAVSAKPAAPEGVLVAADSSAASEIALHQAPAATPDARAAKSPAVTRAMEAIGESRTDLVFLATIFASWGRADATGVALKFIEGKSVELATADDATATTWLRVLEAQRGHLATLSRLVHEVSGAAAKLGMSDPRDPAAAPLREVIDVLAQAAGSSHLNETCAAQIAKAGRLLDNLALEALRGTMRSMAATVDQSRSAAHEDRESHGSATALDRVNVDAERLQAEMVAGRAVDADELADVTLRAEEIALDAKLHGLLVELLDLEHAMEVDGFFEWAAAEMSASFLPTARAIPGLRGKLMDAQEHLRPDGAASPTPGAAQATATRSHRQRALAQAKAEYAAVQSKHDLGEFLREGASLVKWQQVRTACVKVAAMIGVGVVAGAAATAAGKAVAGMLGAGEGGAAAVAELSMAGRIAKGGAEVVADATVNTTGMAVSTAIDRDHPNRSTTGPEPRPEEDSIGATALNNLLFSAASKGVIEPLARDLASLEQAEVTSVTRWPTSGGMIRATSGELAAVTAHAILGAAVGSVTHLFGARALTAPPATLEEWLLQSASIAIGRAIGRRAAARAERLTKANLPKELIAQSRAIETTARVLEQGKGPASEAATLELMAREHAALEAEAQTLDEIRRDPVKLAATGLQWEEAAALSAQANAGLANDHAVAVAAIQFRLAGLEEAVPGALWRGSHDEVVHALAKAREARVEVKATHDPDGHRWGVEIDGQKVSILETIAAETPTRGAQKGAAEAESRGGQGRGTDEEPTPPPGAVLLAGDDARLRAAAARAVPLDGYIDVIVHADVDSFEVVRTHENVRVDHRALATYLRKHGLEGYKIRLIACESGKHPKGIAQHLANQLDVEVLAPNQTAWIDQHGTVGVGAADRHTGRWLSFTPKASSSRSTPVDPLAAERAELANQRRDLAEGPAEPEHAPPESVHPALVDRRVRAMNETPEQLSARMGVKVVVDESMDNGVRARVVRKPGRIVDDLVVREIRIGRNATLDDLLLHGDFVAEVQKYNGALGALRFLAERFTNALRGRPAPKFAHGTRAWVTELELTKLRTLVDERQAVTGEHVAAWAIKEEVTFLLGRAAYHEETIQSLEDEPNQFDLEAPDIGLVTREAEAKGYRLPGEAEGVKPEWYYYRHKVGNPREFELARKATAMAEAPPLRARVVNEEFVGIERPEVNEGATIPSEWSREQVVEHLRNTVGFAEYANMLETHGLASREVVDGVVASKYGQRLTKAKRVTTDEVRHDVKDYFRERVVQKLLDPSLDDRASYAQMREMTKDLPPSDQGTLTEAWHIGRQMSPEAATHVMAMVERSGGENAGMVEKRFVDAVQGSKAVEIKSGKGPIDEGQLEAYLDMLRGNLREGSKVAALEKLEYVFTDPDGAKANLPRFVAVLNDVLFEGRVSLKIYDAQGKLNTITNAAQARAALRGLSE